MYPIRLLGACLSTCRLMMNAHPSYSFEIYGTPQVKCGQFKEHWKSLKLSRKSDRITHLKEAKLTHQFPTTNDALLVVVGLPATGSSDFQHFPPGPPILYILSKSSYTAITKTLTNDYLRSQAQALNPARYKIPMFGGSYADETV